MASEPDPAVVDRMIAAAEALLRRQGFTEGTIQSRRPVIRVQVVNHLRASSHSI